MKKKSKQFIFPVKPVSVNVLYRGRRFSTKESLAYKQELAVLAKQQYKDKPIENDISISVVFHVVRKNSDLDNLLKGFLDSFTGIIWSDDKQIQEIHAKKILSKELKITLEIL